MIGIIIKHFPLFIQLWNMIGQIRAALASGKNLFDLLKETAPALIDVLRQIAQDLFPGLSKEDQVLAGAVMIDTEVTKWIQESMNTFAAKGLITLEAPLVADGLYGEKTKAAVMAYQKARPPLDVDGWAGNDTQPVMRIDLAKLNVSPEAAKAMESAAGGAAT